MKRLLLLNALLLTFSSISQVLYYEDFDNVPGPTAGGPGTYTFPTGMMIRNVDNLTPDANVAYVNDGWERREDFANNVADSCAFSTSWYTPTGASNDWMWTPLIGTIGAGAVLSWNAVTYDASFPDGYEVRIMTASQGPPTGGTGAIGNQITNSTVVFSTAAENTTWTARTVNLASYAGQSVYVGFRNNSNDKFLLLIDDIKVEIPASYDAAAAQTEFSEYTLTPIAQVYPIGTSGQVQNLGSAAITNVNMTLNVFDGGANNVYSETSTAVPSVATGGSSTFNFTGFTPTLPDLYTVELTATMTETDANLANNVVSYDVVFTDSTFARDNGTVSGTLGIGAGNGGQLGQAFTLTNADVITSVSIYIGNQSGNMVGQPLSGGVYATDVTGTPTTLLTSTTSFVMDTTTNTLWTLPVTNGSYNLPAGEYVVVVNEVDSNVTVGTTNAIFTAGKTWVDWPTNPNPSWSNNEDFGFNVSYVIRPNFSDACVTTSSTLNVDACGTYYWAENGQTYTTSGVYSVTLMNAGGCDSIVSLDLTIGVIDNTTTQVGDSLMANETGASYQWIDCDNGNSPIAGETDQYFWPTANGNFAVIVTEGPCVDTSACVLVDWLSLDEKLMMSGVEVFPNPSTGDFSVKLTGLSGEDLKITLTDASGKTISQKLVTNTMDSEIISFNENGLDAGVYLVKISTEAKQKVERLIITRK